MSITLSIPRWVINELHHNINTVDTPENDYLSSHFLRIGAFSRLTIISKD